MTRSMDWIVIHCSDSPHGRGDNAETVHHWHLERGWDGNGYHHVILEDGTIEDARPHWWMGAHVRGYNEHSIGILLIGDTHFTPVQIRSMYQLVKRLQGMYPEAQVCGHRDLDPGKTCPNFDVRAILAKFEMAERMML